MGCLLKVCLDTNAGDSLGLRHAMQLVGMKTPLQVETVSEVETAHLLIYAHVHESSRAHVFEAQRSSVPIIIIGDARLQVLAEHLGATFVQITEYDWQRLYEAMEGALACYPLSYDVKTLAA